MYIGFHRPVNLEIVDAEALAKSDKVVVHVLHFKTRTNLNPLHTLSPATAYDALKLGVDYDLSVSQLLQALCGEETWNSSVVINVSLLEGFCDAGRYTEQNLF